jgi:hypothetical protein
MNNLLSHFEIPTSPCILLTKKGLDVCYKEVI